MYPSRGRLAVVALAALLLPVGGCRNDVVVRLASVVFEDGAIERVLDLVARPGDDDTEPDVAWLADEVGIELAEPDAWARVERDPGRLRAEGVFASAADVPATLSYRTDVGPRSDEPGTALSIRDHGVVRVWDYTERFADPVGRGEVDRAVDRLVDMAVDVLLDEMRAFLGDGTNLRPAEIMLREDGRLMAHAVIEAGRLTPEPERDDERKAAIGASLRRLGVPVDDDTGEPDDGLAAVAGMFAWERERVAAALSTETRTVAPAELTFWPGGDDIEEDLMELIARHRDPDAFLEEATEVLGNMAGYYGTGNSPRLRFDVSARLPGVLLSTNGTPAPDGAVLWLVRAEDLTIDETILRAVTAAVDRRTLNHLGARTSFELPELIRLVDILEARDAAGDLAAALAVAVEAGSLDPLRDVDALPDAIEDRAAELADLLDPAVPLPPAV